MPSSVAKMNEADFALASRNAVVFPFATWPVGLPLPVDAEPGGIVTTNAVIAPEPLYSVDVPERWFETQNGLELVLEMPQGSSRFGSVTGAPLATFETRFVCR